MRRGTLWAYDDPAKDRVSRFVRFQYNPAQVTRTLSHSQASPGAKAGAGDALSAYGEVREEYSFRVEFDATEGLVQGENAPITAEHGIAPQIAVLHMMMRPVAPPALMAVAARRSRAGKAAVAVGRLPLVVLTWGGARRVPVTLKSVMVIETAFDEQLNPIHAGADIGLSVLRDEDLSASSHYAARLARSYVAAVAEVADLALDQAGELR